MARHKKIDIVKEEEKPEVHMTENVMIIQEAELENIQKEIDVARQELEKTKLELEEKKKEIKFTPGRHIDAEEQKLIDKQIAMTSERTAAKDKIEQMRLRDSQMVTGRFMNLRVQGQPVKLTYMKYATDPVKWYQFEDNKVYTIPRGFADQLNGGTEEDPCYYTPTFVQKAGEMNPDKPESAIHAIDASKKKYAFIIQAAA